MSHSKKSTTGRIRTLGISDDEEYVFAGFMSSGSSVYRRNNVYEKMQDLTDPTSISRALSVSSDHEYFAIGSFDKNLYVYKQEEPLYNIHQIINIGFRIICVQVTNEKILVAGISTNILIFQNNGSAYDLAYTLPIR